MIADQDYSACWSHIGDPGPAAAGRKLKGILCIFYIKPLNPFLV